jgi:hypothetical protein
MTFSVYRCGMVVAIAALALASAANAGSIAIFNTGVDVSGIPLPNGTLGDTHYALIAVPDITSTTALRVLTSAEGFPIPPWLGDNGTSAWIGPNNDTQADGPVGVFDYRTTFNLSGFAPDTAALSGQWSMDDGGLDILINGVSTGNTGPGFDVFTPFSINRGFIAGVNTLDFIVNNEGGPTGLRVEVAGTAQTPEPASLALFGAGFAGLCVFRRRLGWAGKPQ